MGLGAWAGPLVVGAFLVPDEHWTFEGLNDSKQVSKTNRELLAKELMRQFPTAFELVVAPVSDIDRYGVGKTHQRAMELALERLVARVGAPDRVIVDGNKYVIAGADHFPKADEHYPCVMAASILAKVHRDGLMAEEALRFPAYGFEAHVGYGTHRHLEALKAHGLCELHRRSYKPMCTMVTP